MLMLLGDGFSMFEAISFIISTLIVVFVTLPVHEFAHGLVAVKLGDPTPRYQGRLTLNPMAHIDWMGSLCMFIAGIGWARPVQVNARNFKNPKWGMAVVAMAGPLSNIILALIALLVRTLLLFLVSLVGAPWIISVFAFVMTVCEYIASISVYLAIFNMIPFPPLDGSRLLSAFLPNKYYYKLMQFERYSFIIFTVLIVLLSRIDFNPISIASDYVTYWLARLASLPLGLLR